MTSGFSGLPKLRQSVTRDRASRRSTATLRYASASASWAPSVRVELAVAAVRSRSRPRSRGRTARRRGPCRRRRGSDSAVLPMHVAVVLVGDPATCRRGSALPTQLQRTGRAASGSSVGRERRLRSRRLQRVDPGRVGDRALVHRAVDGDRARVDVDDLLAVPGDDQAAGVGDLAEHAGLDIPLRRRPRGSRRASRAATIAIMRSWLSDMRISSGVSVGSRSSTLSRSTRMPPSPLRGELARRARDAGGAEVLDALDEVAARTARGSTR